MTQKLLRLRAVEEQTGLSRSTLYRLIKSKEFPAPIQLTGARAVAWDSRAVEGWIQSRLTERSKEAGVDVRSAC